MANNKFDNCFKVSIVTPTSSKNFEDVGLVQMETLEGQVGILANHIKMVFALAPGQISLFGNESEKSFSISDGFAEFSNNILNIIVEQCKAV